MNEDRRIHEAKALREMLRMAREGYLVIRDASGRDLDPETLAEVPEDATLVLTHKGWLAANEDDVKN